MRFTRREFLAAAGTAATACLLPGSSPAAERPQKKPHLVTLSFDDGFKKSSLRTAEIFEKYKLPACLNVIAEKPHPEDVGFGDFKLWNELKARGHELMPHGYKHENLKEMSFEDAKTSVLRCLDVFAEKLQGFDRKQAVFNFPYNASTPELERWLPTQVRAFRTGYEFFNPLPRPGQARLTCNSFGPGNAEKAIDQQVERLLSRQSGWLIFNTHGLDGEGWGPIRAEYLERLLERLAAIDTVEILPTGRALTKYASS